MNLNAITPYVIPAGIILGTVGVAGVAYKKLTQKKTVDTAQEVFKKLLITEWRLIGKDRISQGTNGKHEELRPIFNERTNRDIHKVRQMILNSRNTGCKAPLPNLILTGKPGVGKTMLVETLCQQTGISYIRIPSGSMEKHLNMGTHSNALREIINVANEYANESGIPTIIIMDDGEKLVEQRPDEVVTNKLTSIPGLTWANDNQKRLSDTISECRVALVNTILEEAGKDIRNVGFAITTNRPKVIDKAFKTRANVIAIDPPGIEDRKQIIAYHLPKVFNNDMSLISYFNIRTVTDMAHATEGFTGRNLVKCLEEIYACAQTRNGDLNDDIINACILTVSRATDQYIEGRPVAPALQPNAEVKHEVAKPIVSTTFGIADEDVVDVNSKTSDSVYNGYLETAKATINSARECFDMLVASFKKIKCC